MAKNGGKIANLKKLVAVGDGACGKTCLLMYASAGSFPILYAPTVCVTQLVDVSGTTLSMVDTDGQESYDRLRPLSYVDTAVFLVCFGVDSPDSLANVEDRWMVEVTHFSPDMPVVLVGCKIDLRGDAGVRDELKIAGQHLVSTEEGSAVASKIGAREYAECSALTGEGIKELLECAARVATQGPARKTRRGCVTT